jgi:hypothetical protein
MFVCGIKCIVSSSYHSKTITQRKSRTDEVTSRFRDGFLDGFSRCHSFLPVTPAPHPVWPASPCSPCLTASPSCTVFLPFLAQGLVLTKQGPVIAFVVVFATCKLEASTLYSRSSPGGCRWSFWGAVVDFMRDIQCLFRMKCGRNLKYIFW